MDWLKDDIVWIAPLLTAILVFVAALIKRSSGIRQKQKAGDNSTNIQSGGDMTLGPSKIEKQD